jgi:hypothetical protein
MWGAFFAAIPTKMQLVSREGTPFKLLYRRVLHHVYWQSTLGGRYVATKLLQLEI